VEERIVKYAKDIYIPLIFLYFTCCRNMEIYPDLTDIGYEIEL
jgi:hypothetical protein